MHSPLPSLEQNLLTIDWSLINSPGWSWAHDCLAFTSEVLDLLKCVNTAGSKSIFDLWYFQFTFGLLGHNPIVSWWECAFCKNSYVYSSNKSQTFLSFSCPWIHYQAVRIFRKFAQSCICLFFVWNRLTDWCLSSNIH